METRHSLRIQRSKYTSSKLLTP